MSRTQAVRRATKAKGGVGAGVLAALTLSWLAIVLPQPAQAQQPASRVIPSLGQPLWKDLKAEQQQLLAPFADQWNTLPAEEKRAWVSLANRVPNMSQDERVKAQGRIVEWARLSPDQRRLARQNYRLAKSLPSEQRVAQWESYQTLTPEQQQVLRSSGSTSNTAAKHAGSRTALAKEAAQPMSPALSAVTRKPSRSAKPVLAQPEAAPAEPSTETIRVLAVDPAPTPSPAPGLATGAVAPGSATMPPGTSTSTERQ
jgi:hypothetical protein